MLIVCTKDPVIRSAVSDASSNASNWGPVVTLDDRGTLRQATIQMKESLQQLGSNEPLCFSAHGNDTEIGDADSTRSAWSWKAETIAALLKETEARPSVILVHACAKTVSNFSARLAGALEKIDALAGVWIYGYNKAIDAEAPFPPSSAQDALSKLIDLQGTRV